ncbi:MAG: hypothetical protein U0984_13970, partial [Prosthecobacter sp.]|nr:hypothetical protein [Prosthecobacter sp.]
DLDAGIQSVSITEDGRSTLYDNSDELKEIQDKLRSGSLSNSEISDKVLMANRRDVGYIAIKSADDVCSFSLSRIEGGSIYCIRVNDFGPGARGASLFFLRFELLKVPAEQ